MEFVCGWVLSGQRGEYQSGCALVAFDEMDRDGDGFITIEDCAHTCLLGGGRVSAAGRSDWPNLVHHHGS